MDEEAGGRAALRDNSLAPGLLSFLSEAWCPQRPEHPEPRSIDRGVAISPQGQPSPPGRIRLLTGRVPTGEERNCPEPGLAFLCLHPTSTQHKPKGSRPVPVQAEQGPESRRARSTRRGEGGGSAIGADRVPPSRPPPRSPPPSSPSPHGKRVGTGSPSSAAQLSSAGPTPCAGAGAHGCSDGLTPLSVGPGERPPWLTACPSGTGDIRSPPPPPSLPHALRLGWCVLLGNSQPGLGVRGALFLAGNRWGSHKYMLHGRAGHSLLLRFSGGRTSAVRFP